MLQPVLSLVYFSGRNCLFACILESVFILITVKTSEWNLYDYIYSIGNQWPMHDDGKWSPPPYRVCGSNPCHPSPVCLPSLVTEKHQALETPWWGSLLLQEFQIYAVHCLQVPNYFLKTLTQLGADISKELCDVIFAEEEVTPLLWCTFMPPWEAVGRQECLNHRTWFPGPSGRVPSLLLTCLFSPLAALALNFLGFLFFFPFFWKPQSYYILSESICLLTLHILKVIWWSSVIWSLSSKLA